MSGFLRLAGVMLRDSSKQHIPLSRDIIHEAKARINIMPDHIRQGSIMDENIRTKIISDRQRDVDRAFELEHRLKALVLAMGDHRALSTADVTISRLEGAWQLQQESHRDLASKYDELVYRVRALARSFGLDVGTTSDVLKIIESIDQRWHQMQDSFSDVTGALAFKNKQLREMADCLDIKTPVTDSSIFNDIMVRWTDQESKFNDLDIAFNKEKSENQVASGALEDICKLMGVAYSVDTPNLLADVKGIWTRSQRKVIDLEEELFQEKEKNQQSGRDLQSLAKFFGLTSPVGAMSKILDAIKGKWDQSKAVISHLKSCLVEEKAKNCLANETLLGLAGFMGVEPSGPEPIMVGHMMDRWMESKREVIDLHRALRESKGEVIDLHRALMEEKGRTKQAQGDLQAYLNRPPAPISSTSTQTNQPPAPISSTSTQTNQPPAPISSTSTQTNRPPAPISSTSTQTNQPPAPISSTSTQTVDHEVKSVDLGKVIDKSVQTEHSPRPTSDGQILLRKGATFELQKTPKSNHGEDLPKPICDEPLIKGGNPIMSPQSFQQQQGQGPTYQVPMAIGAGTQVNGDNAIMPPLSCQRQQDQGPIRTAPVKLPPVTVADTATATVDAFGGNANANSNATDGNPGMHLPVGTIAKRSCQLYQSVDRELQMIKGHPALSISSRSRSLSSSTNWERIAIDPWFGRSLESVRSGAATFSPPSKAYLLRGFSSIASKTFDSCPQTSASANITVTKMSDLVPWDESRSRIELGSGVAGSVFLFRHAVSKHPVALKIVEDPGQCFKNEVRIHQAVSGLPWFPAFYGSFDIAGNQSALAMEFIGGGSDDKSYTIADCLENTGPLLTKDEWFDIFNDVADGLKTLHANGFLSNDLKEDNVMLVKKSGLWRAKIIDFGWSSDISKPFIMSLEEEQINNYKNHGGCRHNAPECVLEGKPCSTSSDMYSLGRLMAFVGQEFDYDDFFEYGHSIYAADQDERPTVQEFIDELFEMQLVGGGEDGPGSSSC